MRKTIIHAFSMLYTLIKHRFLTNQSTRRMLSIYYKGQYIRGFNMRVWFRSLGKRAMGPMAQGFPIASWKEIFRNSNHSETKKSYLDFPSLVYDCFLSQGYLFQHHSYCTTSNFLFVLPCECTKQQQLLSVPQEYWLKSVSADALLLLFVKNDDCFG